MAIAAAPRGKPVTSPAARPPALEDLERIPLDLIDVDHNVRSSDQVGDLDELAASIASVGVLQPIRVVPVADGRYALVYGQRRVLAARKAGLAEIPAIVDHGVHVGGDRIVEQLIENIQRHDLNAMDEARALRRILDAEDALTQKELGVRIGRSEAFVSNSLRLLDLAKSVQEMVGEGKLTGAHGKVLAGLPADEQTAVAKLAVQNGTSSHDLEDLARQQRQRAKWAADEAKKQADRVSAALEAIAKRDVPKDTLIVFGGYGGHVGIPEALRKAGYANVNATGGYYGATPPTSVCDCTALRVDVSYDGNAQIHRHCTNEKHRTEVNKREHEKFQQADRARQARQKAVRDALKASARDLVLPLTFARILFWRLLGADWERKTWAEKRLPGQKKPDAWRAILGMTEGQLRSEIMARLSDMYEAPDLGADSTAPAPVEEPVATAEEAVP